MVTNLDSRRPATPPHMTGRVLGGMSMAIGSLPHRSLADAITLSQLATDIVTIPSLPRRSPAESMIAQALVGMGGVSVGQYGSIALDAASIDTKVPVRTDLDHDAFGAFRSFLDNSGDFAGPVKWQFVGPITLGLALHRAGIPTIPVYERRLGNQTGTVQPLLTGATQLSSSPSAWSQADVDAIVRYHTAAWVIGDHDAKHDNLLRTPGGGLVPIDHGQAFKFYGRDKLSASYHPNGSYGASPPVWHQLYEAHRTGGLAPGVTIRPHVAVPVIKAFESIPDAEFVSLLRRTATAGAATAAIHWRDAMTARATAAGHSNPTAGQVADAFIAHGLERKHGLRASFASFLAGEKIAGADILTKTS